MSWSSWDVDPKVVWTISLQIMHLSSRKGSRWETKCYRRDGRQSAWNFHSQPQEICAESQSTIEDTGAYSEENSTEKTAVVPVQTATGTKNCSLMIHPSSWRFVRSCWAGWKRIRVCLDGSFVVIKRFFLFGKVNRHNTGYGDPRILTLWSRWKVTIPQWTCFVQFPEDVCSAHVSSWRRV